MTCAVVVSLDFELRWGLLDVLGDDPRRYRENLLGVEEVVPRLLESFAARDVHATWATVGALACAGWDEWVQRSPPPPQYDDVALRWRDEFRKIDPKGRLYFAPHLVDAIVKAPNQELGSHTFGHVYLREPGLSREDAVRDSNAVTALFEERYAQTPKSLVFPRNQIGHTDVLREHGIRAWRDNPRTFFWAATKGSEQTRLVRVCRLADSLAPMGKRSGPQSEQRASYFLRLNLPEPLWRMHRRRITRDAARLGEDELLHLWCHPHNLGAAPAKSVGRLNELLDAVRDAAPRGVRFASMGELAG